MSVKLTMHANRAEYVKYFAIEEKVPKKFAFKKRITTLDICVIKILLVLFNWLEQRCIILM